MLIFRLEQWFAQGNAFTAFLRVLSNRGEAPKEGLFPPISGALPGKGAVSGSPAYPNHRPSMQLQGAKQFCRPKRSCEPFEGHSLPAVPSRKTGEHGLGSMIYSMPGACNTVSGSSGNQSKKFPFAPVARPSILKCNFFARICQAYPLKDFKTTGEAAAYFCL